MNKRVSMKDIATELNITVDAVCKALHDSPRISKKTKDMVNQKAKELGYIKNYSASTLKTGRTNFIAVFINSFLNNNTLNYFEELHPFLILYIHHLHLIYYQHVSYLLVKHTFH